MASFPALTTTIGIGSAWTGTAPGDGDPTVSGTISSSVDATSWTTKSVFGPKFDTVEFTNFGSAGYKTFKPGLFEADINFEMNQDFASSQVDATVWALFIARTLTYLDIKPTSASRSATNPSIVVAGYWVEYPMEFTVGDAAKISLSFKVTGKPGRLTS